MNRTRTFVTVAVTLAVAGWTCVATLDSSPAGASGARITCSSIRGNAATSLSLGYCTSLTGGSGSFGPIPLPPSPGRDSHVSWPYEASVQWSNGGSTVFAFGEVATPLSRFCPSGSSREILLVGNVVKSFGLASHIESKVFGSVCLSRRNFASLESGTIFKF